MERHIDAFFYGLFMDADVLREKGLNPANLRQASVAGMALRLGDRAALVPDPAGCVHGMLMSLSHRELEQLYAERSVSAYRPEPVLAKLSDGSYIPALCFNLPTPPELHHANPEYADKLRAVARRLRLPENYIENIH